jgi:hypothetical protein
VVSEREDVPNEWLLPEPDNSDDERQTMENRQFNALLQNGQALFRQVFNGARAAMRVLPHPPPARHATDKPYGVRCAVADIKDKKNTEGAVDLLTALRRVEERYKNRDQILDPQVRRPGGNKQSAAAKATHARKRAAPATATAAAPKKKRAAKAAAPKKKRAAKAAAPKKKRAAKAAPLPPQLSPVAAARARAAVVQPPKTLQHMRLRPQRTRWRGDLERGVARRVRVLRAVSNPPDPPFCAPPYCVP